MRPIGCASARALLALVGGAGALVLVPAPASAAPCDRSPAATLFAPREVLVTRVGSAYLSAPQFATSKVVPGSVRVSFLPAAAGGQLTYRYVGGRELERSELEWPLRFAPGDGPATFSVSFQETDSFGDSCERSYAETVTPIATGHLPTLTLRRRHINHSFRANDGTYYEDTDPYDLLRLTIDSGDCDSAALGATRVTVRSGRRAQSFRLLDVCGRWAGAPRRFARYSIVTRPGDRSEARFDFVPGRLRARTRQAFRLTVELAGRKLLDRSFRVRWSYTPDREIDQAEDDFVNVCINEGKRISKYQGRLYCVVDGNTRRRITLLR